MVNMEILFLLQLVMEIIYQQYGKYFMQYDLKSFKVEMESVGFCQIFKQRFPFGQKSIRNSLKHFPTHKILEFEQSIWNSISQMQIKKQQSSLKKDNEYNLIFSIWSQLETQQADYCQNIIISYKLTQIRHTNRQTYLEFMNRTIQLTKRIASLRKVSTSNCLSSRFSQSPYFLYSQRQTKNILTTRVLAGFSIIKRNTYDPNPQKHCLSNTVFMVKPVDFCFNEQTAADNEFMVADKRYSHNEVVQIAIKEFESSVQKLRDLGVHVIVFDKSKYQELKNIKMPDAVFPNNWFNTINDRIIMFRMRATSRTFQKIQLPWVLDMFNQEGIAYNSVQNWSESVVQSTGALIFDRKNKRVFAARSQRCEGDLQKLGKYLGFQMIQLTAKSSKGLPFYHTNIVLSIGEQYAVVSKYALGQHGQMVVDLLKKDRTVIQIDAKQTQQSFCGNIMQVQGKNSKVLIISKTAWNGFTKKQQDFFSKNNKIAMFEIDTIEKIGGGSARCMVAEIFLNQK